MAQLTKKHHDLARPWWYRGILLRNLIQNTTSIVKPRHWADAIAKAIALTMQAEANVESELLAVDGGGYLSLGNALFRIEAVDYIEADRSKALPALRRSVMDEAKEKAAKLMQAAEKKNAELVAEAQRCLQVEEGKIAMARDTLRRIETEQRIHMPTWVKAHALPTRIVGYSHLPQLEIGFWANIQLKTISYYYNNQHKWINAVKQPPLNLLIWTSPKQVNDYGEEWELSSYGFKLDLNQNGWLPHMSTTSCMEIGDLPLSISSYNDYKQVIAGVERAMSDFNTNSPLTHFSQWHPAIKAAIPEQLLPYIEYWQRGGLLYAAFENPTRYKLSEVKWDGVEQQDDLTFNVSVDKIKEAKTKGETNEANIADQPFNTEPSFDRDTISNESAANAAGTTAAEPAE